METVEIIYLFFPSTRSPIPKYPFYMLIETSGSRMDHDEEKLNKFLQYVMEKRLVLDGTVTNEPGKMKVRKICTIFQLISSSPFHLVSLNVSLQHKQFLHFYTHGLFLRKYFLKNFPNSQKSI